MPFTLEVDESFVAAALTVMGYSVADTVIVFDRIREYLREHPLMDMKKTINDAINATLNRTIITSSTCIAGAADTVYFRWRCDPRIFICIAARNFFWNLFLHLCCDTNCN
jgi:preprotein translocase subunit SecF